MSNDILNAVQEYMINGHVSDAPFIINDYVITLERLDNGVRISATRGGQTESVEVYDGDLTDLDHSVLSNRDGNDQHPISAITGLQDNLDSKQSVISDLNQIRSNAQKATTAVQPEDLSSVATSGRYSDLDGKPDLATVATTGSYNDLSDKPSMVLDHNNLTGRFGYNQHTMSSITGLIDNLNSKQSVISDLNQIRSNAQKANTAVQPEDLATVATTGSYNDLLDKPAIGGGTVYVTIPNASGNLDAETYATLADTSKIVVCVYNNQHLNRIQITSSYVRFAMARNRNVDQNEIVTLLVRNGASNFVYEVIDKTVYAISGFGNGITYADNTISADATDAVKYTEQTLTDEQKMQARENQGLYYEKNESIVIEWDGDTTGRATIYFDGAPLFYKVSDRVLASSDLVGATITMSYGQSIEVLPRHINEFADGLTLVAEGVLVLARAGVYNDFYGEDVTVPEDGVYFITEDGSRVTRFEKMLETISKIDPKFLPDTSGAFIVTFTENNGEWTADRTFDETAAAIENGSVCLAKVERVVSGISTIIHFPLRAKIDLSQTNPVGQIAFVIESHGVIEEYALVKTGSTQMAVYFEGVYYDDPTLQTDGKILMSQDGKWTAVTPDFATESYVNQQINAAIGDAIGGEY